MEGSRSNVNEANKLKMPRLVLEGPCDRAKPFVLHTLCMSYVTNTFLLVSSSVRSKQLL